MSERLPWQKQTQAPIKAAAASPLLYIANNVPVEETSSSRSFSPATAQHKYAIIRQKPEPHTPGFLFKPFSFVLECAGQVVSHALLRIQQQGGNYQSLHWPIYHPHMVDT